MKPILPGLVAMLAISAPAQALAPDKFVVFGDSFIDAGALWGFTGKVQPDASLGFWQGRFSDGPSWADHLGWANLGYATKTFYTGNRAGTIPGMPGFTYTPGASNFAVGGARANGDDGLIPGLPTQLGLYSQYLMATGDMPTASTLAILNFGNNDVNHIDSLAGDPMAQAVVAQNYVNNMVGTVGYLASGGVKQILIAGVPNPANPTGQALQAALDMQLDAIETALAFQGVSLLRFDYFAFFNQLVLDPTTFGLSATMDFTTPCLAAMLPGPGMDCSNYLLFDGIHVTKDVQRAIAVEMTRQFGLAAIPEPATWAMMISGFGLVGVAARRRRALAA